MINPRKTHLSRIVVSLLMLFVLAGCKERSIQDEVFYFVLPDRFSNGDPSNDTGGIAGGKDDHGYDAEDEAYFHGGDLKGLKEKLRYLKRMGVTSIWMTPIFKNDPTVSNSAGYHGYWTLDYTQIDPHLGTNEELADLISAAHKMGLKVYFDIVVNHTADVIAYEECHNPDGSLLDGLDSCSYVPFDQSEPSRTPFIPEGLETAKVPEWLNDISLYNNRGDSTFSGESSISGDFFGLDDLNTKDPVVVQGMIDIFKFWISEFKIDGFRLDTVKHVDMSFWQEWAPAIEEHAESEGIEDFFIFGEVFEGNPRVLSQFTTEGMLPSVLDFGMYYAAKDVFAQNTAPTRLAGIYADDDWYNDEDSDAALLMNFISNHDVGRIGKLIQDNNTGESDEEHLARMQLAYALNFFGRGIPVIYYGDEQGFTGDGGDTGSREDMMPSLVDVYNDNDLIGTDATTADDNFSTRHPMYRTFAAYSRLLKQNKALRHGRMFIRHASAEPGIFAFSRVLDGKENEYLVVMNTATTEQEISLPATSSRYSKIYPRGRSLKADSADEITISVDPLSFVIYKGRSKITTPDIETISLDLNAENKVSGRFEVPASVSWASDTLLPMSVVSFEVKVGDGEFGPTGYDGTPDYRVFYNADQHEDGTLLTFRAIARNGWADEIVSEEVTVEVGAVPGLKVIFKKPAAWGSDINIYYWNADPAPAVDWPGVPTESLGNGWYSYQFPEGTQYASLIFNDGTGNQTADLNRDKDGCYIDFAWQDSCEPDTSGGGGEPGFVVYFLKPLDWAIPNVHYWDNSAGATDWPGIPMEALGDDWYKFQFPNDVNASNLIINDGTNQTENLFREGDGCYSIATDSWTDTCAIPGFKVYFEKPADWTASYIYYWNTTAPALGVSWPGVEMEDLGEGWYTYQMPAGVVSSNLIFNSSDGIQTDNLFREGDGCYDFASDTWTDDCDYPRPGLLVRFKKPDAWAASVNIYYWNAGPAPEVSWPGVPATSLGDGWYEYQFPAGANSANLIFNDGQGNQTDNLYRDADGCYGEFGDNWTDNCTVPDNRTIEINAFSAHWLNQNQIVWSNTDTRATQFKILGSASASIEVVSNELQGFDAEYPLASGATLNAASAEKFRHLASTPAFDLSVSDAEAKALLKSQLVVASFDNSGNLLEATRVQAPGVIDDLFSYSDELGVSVNGTSVSVKLWAPTAQSVSLKLYDSSFALLSTETATSVENGVYTFAGNDSWIDQYYRFEVSVYHPESDQIETYEVTDPYSVSLSMNSQYSQIVDLTDSALKPAGWDSLVKSLPAAKDISVYEGHVRDFSAHDPAVPAEHQGKYVALTYNGEGTALSNGMAHLKDLQSAGLTHFHVLPVNDLGSINEDPSARVDINDPYSRLCDLTDVPAIEAGCAEFGDTPIRDVFTQLKDADPTNSRIQAINYDERLNGFPGVDGFNWGYDPYHFNVPEGSYATNPDGKTRILEFREMVKALDEIGLKIVVDVVFNHTYASGLNTQSVLDKVVPGYYHRRNAYSGDVETSTCCDNTAAEHDMMAHLMVQTLKNWAVNYKVDAFRFDLMGHHPKAVMEQLLASVASLTPAVHGVDGANIYFYGEGWDFGEVSGNQRFDQATQFNMAGTGVGTFNDRLRDAVRGGNFSSNGRAQGFANGNEVYPNGVTGGASTSGDQADRIRIGLAGNLQDYPFVDNGGNLNTGSGYSGVGYNLDPQENVVYVDKHDNETLWDNTQGKLPDSLNMDERVRVQLLSQAFVNYSQGIPFHQMATDLLRSKSLDRDSFDAGDWFNKVDFTKQDNNWAVGLPSEDKNGTNWTNISEILGNPNIAPQPEHIELATAMFQEQLAVRYSTPLLRLDSPDDVKQRVAFWNTGSAQTAGLIVMTVSDGVCAGADLDTDRNGLVILFNADDDALNFTSSELAGTELALHSLQQSGVDAVVKSSSYDSASGEFTIPGRTAAVFVAQQTGAQSEFPCNPSNGLIVEPGFTVYFQNTSGWSDVNVYYWGAQPGDLSASWPGVPAEDLGDGWFSFTFPGGVTESNIIFNNGNGDQTTDLFRSGDGCYSDGTWTDSCTLPGMKLWFQKPAEWADQVNIYFWGASVSGSEWPGTPMEDLGGGWYYYQFAEGARFANVIFNGQDGSGNGVQTSDLVRDKNGCYSLDGGWVDAPSCSHP